MEFLADHISPCGGNCMICFSFLRMKDRCPGCRIDGPGKPVQCIRCSIKNCTRLKDGSLDFCYECEKFPCLRMKRLDERYRKNFRYSMINNLEEIRKDGMDRHIRNENERWSCKKCSGTICLQRGYCTVCGEIRYRHIGNKRAMIRTNAGSDSGDVRFEDAK
jgi:hypothetical protein